MDPTSAFLSGRRLLIVEDDPFLAMELHDLLASGGAVILGPVATVKTALGMLDDTRPHAALLDLNLRGQRSTPVAEAMLSASIPFILVTGYSRNQIDEPALREIPIVSKPVDQSILLEALHNLLNAGR
jgi:CheY-like chemotaxis protein